jgi:hypothetical protein
MVVRVVNPRLSRSFALLGGSHVSISSLVRLALIGLLAFAAKLQAQEPNTAPPGGAIVGFVSDATGSAVHTGKAVVFLLDGKTGFPLAAGARGPLDTTKAHPFQFSEYCHAVTDETGAFQFTDVPPGTYRLVAQAWAGVAGMANSLPDDDNGREPSSTLILYGVADNVQVKSGEETFAQCQRQGDGVLSLLTDPEVEHNFIVISSKPLAGEGVLGPIGWGSEFVAGALGITRAENARLTIVGLPNDAHVHVGLMNYDNSVGMGGGEFIVGQADAARLPVYAFWSNGRDDPSPRLLKLTEALETGDVDVAPQLNLGKFSNDDYLQYIGDAWRRADESVDVPGYGPTKLIDVLAADSYRQLRKSHADRRNRGK